MRKFIFAATIAVALLGSQAANAQTRNDDDQYQGDRDEQYEGNRGNDNDRYDGDDQPGSEDERYSYNEDGADEQVKGQRQDGNYNDGQNDNNSQYRNRQPYAQRPPVQGGINRPDYGRHDVSPVRAQYMRVRQVKRMAMADGFVTYRERMMIAREQDRLDWMRSRYGRF